MEAHTLLSRHKDAGQSFFQVIKQHIGPQPTAGRFVSMVRSIHMADSVIDGQPRRNWRG